MDDKIKELVDYERVFEVLEKQQLELNRLQEKVVSLELQVIEDKKQYIEQKRTITELQSRVAELRQGNIDRFNENVKFSATLDGLQQLNVTDEYIEKLNVMLSSHRTVWGNKEKLHISSLASVESCIFNTNSGDIWIGDYVFSGSRVSVLAGSHEVRLKGHLRREYEKKDGYDVIIEDGVWLASNSTILGPAKIGKNSVVAAGSVVVPGTIIPQNMICAGIPARVIKKIDFGKTEKAILDCLDKNGGVVYGDGWTKGRKMSREGGSYSGYVLEKAEGKIYTTHDKFDVFYLANNHGVPQLKYVINGKEMVTSIEDSGKLTFLFEKCKNYPYEILIKKHSDSQEVFFVRKGI